MSHGPWMLAPAFAEWKRTGDSSDARPPKDGPPIDVLWGQGDISYNVNRIWGWSIGSGGPWGLCLPVAYREVLS
jgi:hypothetical protein